MSMDSAERNLFLDTSKNSFDFYGLLPGLRGVISEYIRLFRPLYDTHPLSAFRLYPAAMKMVKIGKTEIHLGQMERHLDRGNSFQHKPTLLRAADFTNASSE